MDAEKPKGEDDAEEPRLGSSNDMRGLETIDTRLPPVAPPSIVALEGPDLPAHPEPRVPSHPGMTRCMFVAVGYPFPAKAAALVLLTS